MQSQSDIIHKLSRKELRTQLFLSQGLFVFIALVLSFFFFDQMSDWFLLFIVNWHDIFLYGCVIAIIIVIFEIILYGLLSNKHFDDGGINEKIFRGESIGWIFCIALVVAVSEEMLFRGVVQVSFGYLFSSSLFALIHVRYLKKPILFILVVLISFLIGYIFLITNNLIVTIVFHFVMDFLLGVFMKYKK